MVGLGCDERTAGGSNVMNITVDDLRIALDWAIIMLVISVGGLEIAAMLGCAVRIFRFASGL